MLRIAIATVIPFLFSACGVTYHNKVERLGSNHNVLLIDATQRAIFSAQRPETQNTTEKRLPVCAEPSPDAISALATSSGFNLSAQDKATLAATLALSEAASSMGLRTQSIQLMRDAMYRLCESYLSGALDPLAFQTQQRRLHSSMVAVLAIEQLTGTVRAPTVLLEGSTVGAANDISKLTEYVLKGHQALDITNSALSQPIINEKAASIAAENAKNEDRQKRIGTQKTPPI